MFVTVINGTVSAAPLAALATVALSPAARSFGTMTACAPNASALRRQAPRLCGSVTPSSTSSSAGSASVSSTSSSVTCGAAASTSATTPWCRGVPASAVSRSSSVAWIGNSRGLRARHEIAHARVVPRRGNVERAHGLGPLPQAGVDGVEAMQGAGGGHGFGLRRRARHAARAC